MAAYAAAAVVAAIAWTAAKSYFAGGIVDPPLLQRDLHSHTYFITGSNTGIGYETALQLAKQHATVVLACRNATLATAARDRIVAAVPEAQVEVLHLDLADLASVRRAAESWGGRPLAGLIANAGVMLMPFGRTVDGFESTIGPNHFGHALLVELLLPALKAGAPSRVVMLSSRAHERGRIDLEDLNYERRPYSAMQAYEQSKLANLLFARELARRLAGTGVEAVSVHPGVVRTELWRNVPAWGRALAFPFIYTLSKSPWEGAQTTLHAVLSPTVTNGAYYADCAVLHSPNPQAHDNALAAGLWEATERILGLQK